MGLRAPDILEKSLLENSDRNLSAAKKAIERLAEARGQDAPSSDSPPNPYILASTHQASQEKAEADRRQLQDRLQSLAAEYEHTIAELHDMTTDEITRRKEELTKPSALLQAVRKVAAQLHIDTTDVRTLFHELSIRRRRQRE